MSPPRVVLLPGLRGGIDELAPLLRALPHAVARPLPEIRADRLDAIAAAIADPTLADADVIVGASFGGLVARALRAQGRTAARLVLIGTLPHPDAPPAARRCALPGALTPALPGALYRRLYARRAAREWAEDSTAPWPADLPAPAVIGARLRAIARWGLPPIPPDTVVAWGTADRFVTWTDADVRRWGAAPLPLPGAHRPHLRDADGLLDALQARYGVTLRM